MRINWKLLPLALFVSFLPGWIGAVFTYPEITTWYVTIQKPFFTPPNFVFGPVWTLLYFLMGIALYILWTKKTSGNKKKNQSTAVKFFYAQLILNAVWSIVFFFYHQLFISSVIIIFLWVFIFKIMKYSQKFSQIVFYLLLPYLLWVSFATILNISLFALN